MDSVVSTNFSKLEMTRGSGLLDRLELQLHELVEVSLHLKNKFT
jgi:hypothetical protein